MGKRFNEDSRVKIPAIMHLTRLNFNYVSLKDAAPFIDEDTNIYRKSFRAALNKINRANLTDSDVDRVISDLKNLLDAEDLGRNFYEKICAGITYNEENFQLIDFERIDANIFEIMAEVPYKSGRDSFRPDVTVFVNGLPLAFVEVKIPDNRAGIQAEHRRMNERFKQKKYRRFANITQLMIFSNNSDYDDKEIIPLQGAFYATSDYEKLYFNRFREEDKNIFNLPPLDEVTETKILRDLNYLSIRTTKEYVTNKNPLTPTNKILTSLLTHKRFIFILRYALAYVTETTASVTKTYKHVMRYQQIFAAFGIRKMLERGNKHGVIWHTQGSGKTALAYFSVKFLTDYFQQKNFSTQFYFIVDRIDLAEQADKEFKKRDLESNLITSKENFIETIQRAGSLGASGKLTINVVNIQKFSDESVTKESAFNVNVQRIYFIDEAHRDYKWDGSFLARLMKSDRNAVMIALTGTPLIGEFKTREIFGAYIHTYFYNRSIADGYTLRLIREGIKTEYRLKLQAAVSKLQSQVAKGALSKDEIYCHENYLRPLVDYIEKDFAQSRQRLNDSIGAMIVCNSSEQAQAVCAEINLRGNFTAELVLSTLNFSDKELEDKRTNFKRGNVDFLVVYNMLLTGFDAPRLKKLYLGRKITAHNLLQALTRVNRPYDTMRYGYVVDFADIQAEFDKTNQAYMQELKSELGDDFSTYQKIFKTQAEIEDDLKTVREKLFSFDTSNAENFRLQLHSIEDKKILAELRGAIELYREDYNLAENYGFDDLKNKFDVDKIFELSKVVNQRLQLLRQKEMLNDTQNISAFIAVALEDIEFRFTKISISEMVIADAFLDVRRNTCREFELNDDKADAEFVTLIEELRRILNRYNVEEMTAAQMYNVQRELDELRKKIHNLNESNSRLTAKYFGDKKFMRVHKRLAAMKIFNTLDELYNFLMTIKISVDDRLAKNFALVDNEPYFKRILRADIKRAANGLTLDFNELTGIIAQEYFNERNVTT